MVSTPNHENPFGPTTYTQWVLAKLTSKAHTSLVGSRGGCLMAEQPKQPAKKVLKLPPPKPALRVKPTFMQKSIYRHLMDDDPNVYRWFRKHLRRSPTSAQKHLSRLGWLCEHFDTTPSELARLGRRNAEVWTEDMINLLEDEGKRSSYISNLFKTAKSWFKHNKKQIEVEYKVSPESGLYGKEKPPTNEELRRILDASDLRQKVAVSLMAFCGFRDQTLGDLTGIDGLKIGDFPEMKVANGSVEFATIPTFVTCRAPVSKSGYEYVSLLNAEGSEYLRAYLMWRMQSKEKDIKQVDEKTKKTKTVRVKVPGEILTTDSPIITPVRLKVGSHIHTTNINGIIKKAITKAGYTWRPYALRRYFAKRLLRAEDDGLIPFQYAKFWFGHHGEMLLRYTLEKGLDTEDLERLRNAYRRLDEAHLTTYGKKPGGTDVRISMRDTMLEMLGYTEEERQKLDLAKLSDDEFQDLLRKKAAILFGLNGTSRQKMVPMTQVAQAISEGWEFITQLPNDQAIVRTPN
jgi:integrase